MAESQTEPDVTALMEKVECLADVDEDRLRSFVETAIKNIDGNLHSNRREAIRRGFVGDDTMEVAEVMDPDNVEKIEIRAKPLEQPRVTFWHNERLGWANDAWTEKIYPFGMNAYNGDTHVTFDVRPF